MSERLLTARELADLLGLKPATVLDKWQRVELPSLGGSRPLEEGREADLLYSSRGAEI